MSRSIQPAGWKRPQGYANGVVARGEQICVAGQVGWNADEHFESDDFVDQAAQALRNVVAVLQAAGAEPADIVRLVWYVTDKRDFKNSTARLGEVYRKVIGPTYPAMTFVQVAALLEDRAKVEIEATAVRRMEE